MKSLMSQFFRAASWAGLIDKNNALQLAARKGHTRMVKALLDAGADIHYNEDAALRLAAWWGRTETAEALLEGGADIHAANDEALKWAKDGQHVGTMNLLQNWTSRRHLNECHGLHPQS